MANVLIRQSWFTGTGVVLYVQYLCESSWRHDLASSHFRIILLAICLHYIYMYLYMMIDQESWQLSLFNHSRLDSGDLGLAAMTLA